MNDAARVSVGDRVADGDKGIEQIQYLKGPGLAGSLLLMVILGSLAQRPAAHKTHGVIRLPVLRSPGQLVNRHDPRMLKLAGDPRLLKEASPKSSIIRALRPELLEGHIAP